MRLRILKLRFRRSFRKGQQQVGDIGSQAEKQIERHLFERASRLRPVRRFVATWLGLVGLLIIAGVIQNFMLSGYYQTLRKVPGGIYSEGVKGRFTNANPLFAVSSADTTVSKLIFAGLLTYNNDGKLVGDLAQGFAVDSRGSTYTLKLRPNLKWHDGRPVTSDDVVFTYKLIQNPDVQSPLKSAWEGIEITATDKRTVIFKLPGVLAAFPHSLTNGIVPKHSLEKTLPRDLRTADFNTVRPVGAGPFRWQNVQVSGDGNPKHAQQQIGLSPFEAYHAGKPKLQRFVVHVYADEDQLVEAYQDDQLTAVVGLDTLPQGSQDNKYIYNLPLRAANMVFFKTSTGILSSKEVRQALVRGANTEMIVKKLDYPTKLVREPILQDQPGYDRTLMQPSYDLKAARTLLDSAGWRTGKDGMRSKDKQTLSFNLTVADTPEYRLVSRELRRQWQELGVKVNLRFLGTADFQNALAFHDYDAILYGISIGADPDVFVYWDSSQADIRSTNRLNLSEFKNPAADTALEAGRTRLDPVLRTVKYRPFLEAWQQESPALGLYQPRVLYLANTHIEGLVEEPINTPTDRLNNVHNWMIREARVTND